MLTKTPPGVHAVLVSPCQRGFSRSSQVAHLVGRVDVEHHAGLLVPHGVVSAARESYTMHFILVERMLDVGCISQYEKCVHLLIDRMRSGSRCRTTRKIKECMVIRYQ